MTRDDLDRIPHRAQAELAAACRDRILAQSDPPPFGGVDVKLLFTEYDKGSAFAGLMLAGLGQIRIGANVFLIQPASNRTVGAVRGPEAFAFAGLYGGATGIEDVEDSFARSVAAILKTVRGDAVAPGGS
jgi:hypothetical protein